MEAGQYATLNKDVGFKKVVYSKKGTKVKIISVSGNAVIYETENGKRFPCNIKDLEWKNKVKDMKYTAFKNEDGHLLEVCANSYGKLGVCIKYDLYQTHPELEDEFETLYKEC